MAVVRKRLTKAREALDDLGAEGDRVVELRLLIERASRFADDIERFGPAAVDALVADVVTGLNEAAEEAKDAPEEKRNRVRFVASQLALGVGGNALFVWTTKAGRAIAELL